MLGCSRNLLQVGRHSQFVYRLYEYRRKGWGSALTFPDSGPFFFKTVPGNPKGSPFNGTYDHEFLGKFAWIRQCSYSFWIESDAKPAGIKSKARCSYQFSDH